MADDRPIEMPEEQIGRLQTELDELRALFTAAMARKPTGDIEPTVRSTAKPDTLLLTGGTHSRASYPRLWQWAQDNALVFAGLFTAGDGSTTFTVPNFAGRVPIGVGTLGTDVYGLGALVGASAITLAAANIPSHTHSFSGTSSSDSHGHSGNTGGGGDHGGHSNATETTPGGQYGGVAAGAFGGGGHSHGFSTSSDSHSHTLSGTTGAYGSGTPIDNRQPSIVVNWLIWT